MTDPLASEVEASEGSGLDLSNLLDKCPKCGASMESGWLSFQTGRTYWQRTKPKHFWQIRTDAENRLTSTTLNQMVWASGSRCRNCGVIAFESPKV